MDLIALVQPLIGAILSIFGYILAPKVIKKYRWVFVILIIVSLVFLVMSLQQQYIKGMESSPTGTISLNTKNIIYPCVILGDARIAGEPEGFIPIRLGKGVSISGPRRAEESNYAIQSDEDKMIVWIENGQLKVSTVVRDKDGKILATMFGNDFFTMPRPAILDRNYDKNSLEVVDIYGNVVLQVSMIGQCAQIFGCFFGKSGGGIIANESGLICNPTSPHAKISPIFVHPCEGHLGERIDKF